MFDDLILDVDKVNETDGEIISVVYSTDEEIIAMYRETALNDVKIDVLSTLGLKYDDTRLDDYVASYPQVFEMLLRYKQLSYFYYSQSDVEGRMKQRENHYKQEYSKTLGMVGKFSLNLDNPVYKRSKGFMRY